MKQNCLAGKFSPRVRKKDVNGQKQAENDYRRGIYPRLSQEYRRVLRLLAPYRCQNVGFQSRRCLKYLCAGDKESEFLKFLKERLARRAKTQMLLQLEVPAKVEPAIQIAIQEAIDFFTVHLVTPYDELPKIPDAGA